MIIDVHTHYSIKMMNELDLCQFDKDKILDENAKRLFKIS